MKKTFLVVLICLGSLSMVGCNDNIDIISRLTSTPIEKVVSNPQDYESGTVIAGKVTWTAGLGRKSLYKINDGTGEICVLSNSQSAPPIGTRVRVKGYTKQYFRINRSSMLVFKQTETL